MISLASSVKAKQCDDVTWSEVQDGHTGAQGSGAFSYLYVFTVEGISILRNVNKGVSVARTTGQCNFRELMRFGDCEPAEKKYK